MAWDLTNAVYENKSFSVSSQDTSPESINIKPDGTKMYVSGRGSNALYQYSLATPWDVNTATYDSVSFTVLPNTFSARFKPDGTKCYFVRSGSQNRLRQMTLSTAWDLSTMSFEKEIELDDSSFNTQIDNPQGLAIKTDGTKFYVTDNAVDTVYELTMSTPWDIATRSTTLQISPDLTSTASGPYALDFRDNGLRAYIVSVSNDKVVQFDLNTAWDITSLNTTSAIDFSVLAQETLPTDIFGKPDGTKFYITGYTDSIYQYSFEPLPEKASLLMHHMQIAGQITN